MARSAYGLAYTSNCVGPRWCAQLSKNWITCAPHSIWWHAYSPTASAKWLRAACRISGLCIIIFLVAMQWRLALPSTAYATSVNGEPTKPMSVEVPSVSLRSVVRISRRKGSFTSGSCSGVSAFTCSIVRSGVPITGPVPLITSNSTPSAGSGVRMSENITTPSTPKALNGCSDSSTAISGVSERMRNGYFSEYLRKSAMYRPAWRISQTGVREVSSPRAHRSRMSWSSLHATCARWTASCVRCGVRSACCAGAKARATHVTVASMRLRS
mmetsp:Transcript_64777/g.156258  ORF Transcript_64777/g.156258 Transcript_64777/m.156258 type:complete len:270 (-) Transcript_64777:5-814(-)